MLFRSEETQRVWFSGSQEGVILAIQPTGKAGVDLCNVGGNPVEEGDEDEANPHHGKVV